MEYAYAGNTDSYGEIFVDTNTYLPRNGRIKLKTTGSPQTIWIVKFVAEGLSTSARGCSSPVDRATRLYPSARGCSSVVERSLCMWKAPGSIPGISSNSHFLTFKTMIIFRIGENLRHFLRRRWHTRYSKVIVNPEKEYFVCRDEGNIYEHLGDK